MCHFEFKEYKEVMDRVIFKDFSGDIKQDPHLDLRLRLKLNVEEGEILRQIYRGGEIHKF